MATQEELQKRIIELEDKLAKAKVFQQFVEASGQGLAMATLEGIVTYVNSTLCRIADEDKPEDFYGKPLTLYYPEELQPRLQSEVLPAVMQKGQWIGELAIRSTKGKITPTLENIFLIRDEQGKPLHLADVMTDISERKQVEAKSEEQYRHLVEKHPYGIHENDASGIITYANPAYCQIFDFSSPEEVVGKPIWLTMKTEEEQEQLRQYLAYLVNEQPPPSPYESKSFTKDGQPIDIKVDWDYRRDEQGQIIGFISVTTDITEQKQAETERERLQQEVIEAQQRALKELSTPIIPVMDTPQGSIIVMPLVGSIDTMRARDVTRALLAGISQYRAKVVILDITGVPIVDSGVANHLNKTIQAARLKGARTVITGISDAVAEAIVDLGIDWSGVQTLRDLQTGLVVALNSLGFRVSRQVGK